MNIDDYTFTLPDHDGIVFPKYLKCKNKDEYYNFRKAVTSSNHSRSYQLSNRSVQAHKFDALIEVCYFKVPIVKEFVIINKDLDNDPNRSYYLLDYYIPSKGICIELDSNLHDKSIDNNKDRYLNSLGIEVIRFNDYWGDPINNSENLCKKLNDKFNTYINFDYSDLIEDSINNYIIPNKSGKIRIPTEYDIFRPKWRIPIEKLCSLSNELHDAIVNNKLHESNINISLDLRVIDNLIPFKIREVRAYYPLINYLKKFNINLKITSRRTK